MQEKSQSTQNQLKVMLSTLNYSGILISPFQFFQNKEGEELDISQCFIKLLGDRKKWDLGKIDQQFQKGRYTPIYNQNAGVINGQLINKATFQNMWKKSFNLSGPSEQNKNECLAFDFHCYKTLVYYLYKVDIQKQTPKQSSLYTNLMKKYFQKKFLNQQQKLKRVAQAIKKCDMFFIQQATTALITKIRSDCKNYNLISNQQISSSIVVKRNLFRRIQQKCDNVYEYFKKTIKNFNTSQNRTSTQKFINWLQDSVIFVGDNTIFICVHLSSKKDKNQPQIRSMMQSIHFFINDTDTEYKKDNQVNNLIICGDVNSNLLQLKAQEYKINASNRLYLFPHDKNIATSIKKRTMLQPQFDKGLKEVKECKDSIISTVPLQNQKVLTITNLQIGRYLPNQQHPFDHYVVNATAQIKK